jgi:alkylation response protein AidB-like acyl-CoA dehydrogenase
VNLTFSPEQEELRAAVRRLLADKAPSEAVRRWMESDEGYDPALWRQMAAQLGLQGLAVPEEFGGAGYGPVELGIVFEEMGRGLLPGPFFATVGLAAQALTASGDLEAQAR